MGDTSLFNILLIDDDPKYVDRIVSLLGHGYDCHTAMSGAEGVFRYTQLYKNDPLVICDLNLPDMSGFEVCESIKAKHNAYVMMLTAYADKSSRMSCLKAQADHYLDKGIDDEELKLIIRNVCHTLHPRLKNDQAKIYNGSESQNTSTPSKDNLSLEENVRAYILSSYDLRGLKKNRLKCTSSEVAEALNKSHRTFQREIKQETDLSFKQLHVMVRLEYSKKLFDCGYNVSQVADALDFSSPSHLSRSFKEQFGLTPSNYRNA